MLLSHAFDRAVLYFREVELATLLTWQLVVFALRSWTGHTRVWWMMFKFLTNMKKTIRSQRKVRTELSDLQSEDWLFCGKRASWIYKHLYKSERAKKSNSQQCNLNSVWNWGKPSDRSGSLWFFIWPTSRKMKAHLQVKAIIWTQNRCFSAAITASLISVHQAEVFSSKRMNPVFWLTVLKAERSPAYLLVHSVI